MQLQIDLWHLIGIEAGLLAFFLAALAGMAKLLLGQIQRGLDERFSAQDHARAESSKAWSDRFGMLQADATRLAQELGELQLELAQKYQRREDAIRDQTITQAKVDALAAKMDLLMQLVKATQ